jgi:hypothetical protein
MSGDHPTGRTADDWLGAVKEAERRGELLAAYDLASRALAEHPQHVGLRHRAVLLLARAGATRSAARRFAELALTDERAVEDVAALEARIAKDFALAGNGAARRGKAAEAAALYAGVHRRTGGYYPAINAATLFLLAGRDADAESHARAALAGAAGAPAGGEDAYYRHATMAEAHLVLGDLERSRAALAQAAAAPFRDQAAYAATRRQLRLICGARGADPSFLEVLHTPRVIHYCGHRLAGAQGRLRAADLPALRQSVDAWLADRDVGFGYGALASGADILVAEALLARGAELHVVLPFAREEFVAASVADGGPDWVARFDACLARAASLSFATEDSYLGDDALFPYAARLAMGLAVLRAAYLDTGAEQLALWDGQPPAGVAGTAVDVAAWRALGRPQTVIPTPVRPVPAAAAGPVRAGTGRAPRAMIFGDIKGFSKLRDAEIPRFVDHVLGAMARALEPHEGDILFHNTWGDGLFLVLRDSVAAARCALDLQAAVDRLDRAALGLPAHLGLRLGAHTGPVYGQRDPLLRRDNFFGAHVSRAARIEPITPVGDVYVTEAFAAELALQPALPVRCDYVGHMPAAKGYGSLRMYLLRRSAG